MKDRDLATDAGRLAASISLTNASRNRWMPGV